MKLPDEFTTYMHRKPRIILSFIGNELFLVTFQELECDLVDYKYSSDYWPRKESE